jgi:hypothetical protein
MSVYQLAPKKFAEAKDMLRWILTLAREEQEAAAALARLSRAP